MKENQEKRQTPDSATPFFSIVIPTYNRAHLLPRTLRSIRKQSLNDFEVIVVDDGSTDGTERAVHEAGDERVRYIYQQNAGAGSARNRGVRHARSDRIVFIDSDDEALDEWLETFQEAFERHDADVVCCGQETADEQGDVHEVTLPRRYGPAFKSVHGLFHGSIGIRKGVFEAIGGYDERLPSGQHTDLTLRLVWHSSMSEWKFHSIMKPLVRVHIHGGARIREDLPARYSGGRALLEKHEDKFRKDPEAFALTCGSVGVNAFRMGERAVARRLFVEAAKADPAHWKRWARVVLAYLPPLGEYVWNRPGRAGGA